MDWFSWLSKTSLDPTLIYEYGLVFARNELQLDDVSYFNHEFLQSMGVSVAKHRLEILKIAKKGNGGLHEKSGLVSAFRKTKKCLRKCLNKLGFHEEEEKEEEEESMEDKAVRFPELTYYTEHRRSRDFSRKPKTEDFKQQRSTAARTKERAIAFSGPLDGTGQPRMIPTTKSLKLSGPLDGKLIERLLIKRSPKCSGPFDRRVLRSPNITGTHGRTLQDWFLGPNKSPRVSGSLICSQCNKERVEFEDDDPYLWASLFQDMKPT